MEWLFSQNFVNFLCVIGLYALLCYLYDNFKSLFGILKAVLVPFFLPQEQKSLVERYGKWAVVTGSTDGIGLEYSKQLAKQGLNIVLISRTESKLNVVAKEIESKFGVKTKIIAIDFGKSREIYDVIRKELESLDVGILVNNVGSFHEFPDTLDKVPEDLIWNVININVGAVTMLSRMVIPKMKENQRGIIVNVSSGTELQPLPLGIVYASSKTFIKNFTLALQKELEEFNIEVQLLSPMYVKTKMNNYSTSVMNSKRNIFIPDCVSYAKWAVFTLGKTSQTNGYWSHGIQAGITKLVPESIRTIVGFRMMKNFREEYLMQQR